jgi:hypothetical protein
MNISVVMNGIGSMIPLRVNVPLVADTVAEFIKSP